MSDCLGTDATIIANTVCTVAMLDLQAATGLSVDTLIKVKVAARNGKGYGSYSELNTAGAVVESLPTVMTAPNIDTTSIVNT